MPLLVKLVYVDANTTNPVPVLPQSFALYAPLTTIFGACTIPPPYTSPPMPTPPRTCKAPVTVDMAVVVDVIIV